MREDALEREIELRCNVACFAGGASALENFGKLLRAKAGELYSRGDRDSLANTYREIAELCESTAKKERGRQRTEQERLDEELLAQPEEGP